MRDIQVSLLESDTEEDAENSVDASIEVPSQPRHALQKKLRPNPVKKTTCLSSKSNGARAVSNPKMEAIVATAEILSPKAGEKGLVALPLQNNNEAACSNFTIFKFGAKFASYLNEEWNELVVNPIDYFKTGLHSIWANLKHAGSTIINYCKSARDYLTKLTTSVYTSVTSIVTTLVQAFDYDPALTIFKNSSSSPNSSLKVGSRFSKGALGTNYSAGGVDLTLADSTEGEYLNASSKKKGVFELLLEGVQKVVAALLEKKEQQRKSELEEAFEHKEKLEKEARERLRQAESLRPDLVGELDLPSTDFIFASAFDEIPNVDELIRRAEEKRESKKVIN